MQRKKSTRCCDLGAAERHPSTSSSGEPWRNAGLPVPPGSLPALRGGPRNVDPSKLAGGACWVACVWLTPVLSAAIPLWLWLEWWSRRDSRWIIYKMSASPQDCLEESHPGAGLPREPVCQPLRLRLASLLSACIDWLECLESKGGRRASRELVSTLNMECGVRAETWESGPVWPHPTPPWWV